MKKAVGLLAALFVMVSSVSAHAAENAKILVDANGDGYVNINDVTCIQRHVAELEMIPEENRQAALVSGEKTLSIQDATLIQQYLAEMIDRFPAEENSELKMTVNSTPVTVE